MGAKTAVKRVVAKKTKAVKQVKKACAKAQCACKKICSEAESFWVNNGPVVNSLPGLKEAMRSMTDEQYGHHVGADRNDFANWVRDCMGDAVLAGKLARAKTKQAAMKLLPTRCCK